MEVERGSPTSGRAALRQTRCVEFDTGNVNFSIDFVKCRDPLRQHGCHLNIRGPFVERPVSDNNRRKCITESTENWVQVRKAFRASMEFLRETHTARALRQGPGVSAATPIDDASMLLRGSVSLANSHRDGFSRIHVGPVLRRQTIPRSAFVWNCRNSATRSGATSDSGLSWSCVSRCLHWHRLRDN